MAEGGGTVDSQSLQDLFKKGWDAQKAIEKDDLSSNSEEFKVPRSLALRVERSHIFFSTTQFLGAGVERCGLSGESNSLSQPAQPLQPK